MVSPCRYNLPCIHVTVGIAAGTTGKQLTLRQRMRHDYSGWTSQETGFGATGVDLLSSIKRLVLQT
jgi:hypothetical protein